MNQDTLLTETGLSEKEAKIYQILLKIGTVPAKNIILESAMPRGTVYEILDQLTKKDLIEALNQGTKTHFRAKHPLALKQWLEAQKNAIDQTNTKLDSLLPTFIDMYHGAQNRPGVQFFEGKGGIQKVLEDSLTATGEIYTYVDIEAIMHYIPEINSEYVKKREKLGIQKKGIIIDTPVARKYLQNYATSVTDSKLVPIQTQPTQTIMQIYDNKISYITLGDQVITGTIIADVNIYTMHKQLFEYTWEKLPPLRF